MIHANKNADPAVSDSLERLNLTVGDWEVVSPVDEGDSRG